MVHRRSIDDADVVFGNQGALFGNAMTWFDYATGSIWSQPLGEAILGPAKGTRLELLPSTLTRWGEWKRLYPRTMALDAPGQNAGYALEDLTIVAAFGDDSVAYAYRDIDPVVNDTVGGVPIAVVVEPINRQSWSVWSRTLNDGVVVDLSVNPAGDLVDSLSGTTFRLAKGTGIDGRYADQSLDLLPAFTSFERDYFTFYPNGRVWPDSS